MGTKRIIFRFRCANRSKSPLSSATSPKLPWGPHSIFIWSSASAMGPQWRGTWAKLMFESPAHLRKVKNLESGLALIGPARDQAHWLNSHTASGTIWPSHDRSAELASAILYDRSVASEDRGEGIGRSAGRPRTHRPPDRQRTRARARHSCHDQSDRGSGARGGRAPPPGWSSKPRHPSRCPAFRRHAGRNAHSRDGRTGQGRRPHTRISGRGSRREGADRGRLARARRRQRRALRPADPEEVGRLSNLSSTTYSN